MINKEYYNAAESAAVWLIKSQNAGDDDGFASHYHNKDGWYPSYPEVTGYILPTIIAYTERSFDSADLNLIKKSVRAANWLLSIQLKSGAFQGRLIGDTPTVPVIFNTGMIVFGLIAVYKKTKCRDYLNAAIKAGDWLIDNQDDDGVWRKYLTLNGTGESHIYHTRVSWALLELFKTTGKEEYCDPARKNIVWALTHQKSSGWFDRSCLLSENNDTPLIHFLVYTIRGILEAGLLLNISSWINAAERAAKGFLRSQQKHNTIYARYNKEWEPAVDWICPTGVAQISIVYLKLYLLNREAEWLEATDRNLEYLMSIQGRDGENVKGAIPGSDPIDGPYMPNSYLSWATKFFLEALILREELK